MPLGELPAPLTEVSVYGFPFGGETALGGWQRWLTGGLKYQANMDEFQGGVEVGEFPAPVSPSAFYGFGNGIMQYFVYDDPDWSYVNYSFDTLREEMEQAFDMHAVDIYGLSEVIGPGVANECVETKDGLHIWEDHFFPEVINPETGEPVADGEKGELVFTSLTKEAFPIIRYRTRDLTRLMPGTARSMRRMEKVTGRSDDMIILRGVNVFPTQIEEQLLKVEGLSPHYQIELSKSGALDMMTVHVEAGGGAASAEEKAASATQLENLIKGVVGVSCKIDVRDPGGIERSAGKAVRVVDRR